MIRPWNLVHRGMVRGDGVWIDLELVEESVAMERVIACWQRGDSLWMVAGGWLHRFASPRCEIGLPVVQREGILVAAPLREVEFEERPLGDLLLVRGGRLVAFALEVRLRPETWLDLSLPRLPVRACTTPPVVAVAGRSTVRVDRASFGVAPPSAEADDLWQVLSTPLPEPPPAPEPQEPGWLERLGRWFQAEPADTGTPPQPSSPSLPPLSPPPERTGPTEPGMFDGLAGFLERWLGTTAQEVGLTEAIQRRQAGQLQELLDRFENNPLEALRHAIPLGGQGLGAHPALRMPSRRDALRPGLGGGGGGGGAFSAAPDLFEALRSSYRAAAEALVESGEIEQAAFVHADLLHDPETAVALLEEHGRYRLAAELAQDREMASSLVARLWMRAGEIERAFEIASTDRIFGELLASMPEDDRLLRAAYAAHLVGLQRYQAAVDLVWNSDLRSVCPDWLLRLATQGGPGAPLATVRLGVLGHSRAEALFQTALTSDALTRQRLMSALGSEGEPRSWARPLARLALGDSGQLGFAAAPWHRLAHWQELSDLRVDAPYLEDGEPGPVPDVLSAASAGGVAVLDIAWVYAGTLCALGNGGLVLLDVEGQVCWRDATPCSALVVVDEGFMAIGLHGSGPAQRLSRVDLRLRTVRPWVRTSLQHWARDAVFGQWLVVAEGRLLAVEVNAPAWQWIWKGPEVAPGHLALFHGRAGARVWMANELLTFDDIWFLRGRTPLIIEQPRHVDLSADRWAAATVAGFVSHAGNVDATQATPALVGQDDGWFVEHSPAGHRVRSLGGLSLRVEGVTAVGLRSRPGGWIGVFDDCGRVSWWHPESSTFQGPFTV